MPSEEALLKCLEMEWSDHFQTRQQTWKPLQMEVALALALVGTDWNIENVYATIGVSILLILAACFGIAITRHHRNVEIQKLTHIYEIENRLGLIESVFTGAKKPEIIKFLDIFLIKKNNTSIFILRAHIIVILFAAVYVVSRLILGYEKIVVL